MIKQQKTTQIRNKQMPPGAAPSPMAQIMPNSSMTVAEMAKTCDLLKSTDPSDNIALKKLYEKLGDGACDLKNYAGAIEYYLKMLHHAELAGDCGEELIPIYVSLYETYVDMGCYNEALQYYEKEYELIKDAPKKACINLYYYAYALYRAKKPYHQIERACHGARKAARDYNKKKNECLILNNLLRYQEAYLKFDKMEETKAQLIALEYDNFGTIEYLEISEDEQNSAGDGDEHTPHIGGDVRLEVLTGMTPPEKKSAKKRKHAMTQKNITEATKKPRTETFRPSSSRRVVNGDPTPDVRNIPCSETGYFINKSSKFIEVRCSFCTQKFDRPDDYYLHQAEKHVNLYRHLPNQPTNSPTNKSDANNVHIQNNTHEVINHTSNRRQRCSGYVSQQSDTSSIEASESDSEVPNTNEADNYTQENLNAIEPKRKKKKVFSKSKETDLSSRLNGDDSSSDSEIQNLLRKFVKLSKSLVKRIRIKKEKRIKVQRNIIYKCNECSLHFLKESEWRKHIKRADHPTNPSKCEHCMLKFSDKSLPEHVKLHMEDGQIQKKDRFNVVTETYTYSSSEDSTSSDETSSDSDDEENKSVHNSNHEKSYRSSKDSTRSDGTSSESYGEENNSVYNSSHDESSNKNVKDSVPTEIEQHINCTDTDKDNRTNEFDSNKLVNAKKRFKAILYKCDDCEKHFLTEKNLVTHTYNSFHYSIVKDFACNICSIKFSSTKTLIQHKQLHHSGTDSLSKEDFKILSCTDLLKEKSSEDSTSSDGTSSESHVEENNSVPYSSRESSNKNVKKSLPTEKEQHINCTGTDNVNNTNEVDSNKQVNAKNRFKAILYKCDDCEKHFITEKKLITHRYFFVGRSCKNSTHKRMVKYIACNICTIIFSGPNTLIQHKQLHHSDTDNLSKEDFKIIPHTDLLKEKSYSSSKDSTSSAGTSSDTDGEEKKSVPNSSHDSCIKNVKESVPTEKEQQINCTDTDNVNKSNEIDSNKQFNAKKLFKAILYKCADCEKHFLTKKNVIIHTKNSTHNSMAKDIACNICTIKFSSTNALIQHKKLHHSDTENLSKEDFKIIPWTKYGKSLPDRARVMNPRKIYCTGNLKKSPKKNLNNFILYRCEGCDTHFTRYKTWWSHLNYRCKNTISYNMVEKCPNCEIYFSPSSFPEHLKVHEDNPDLLEHQFRVQSRKPKNFKNKLVSQSNIVSTTEAEVEPPSATQTADSESLVNQGNDRDTSSASELCKIKLTKTTTGGAGQGEGWKIVMNQSLASMNANTNSNPPLAEEVNASTIDDHINTNQAFDQNSTRDVETDCVDSTVEINAKTVSSKYFSSVTDMTNIGNSVTDPHNKTSHHTEQTVSSENNKNKTFDENVIVNIPRLPSNGNNFQNNTPSEESTNRFIVSKADTTTENLENINVNSVNNEKDQNKIQEIEYEREGAEMKTESDAHIPGGVLIQNECIKEEIKSENDSFEPQKPCSNKNIKTETVMLEADQQIKNELFAEEIKAESIVPEEDPQIKKELFIEEIKIKNESLMEEIKEENLVPEEDPQIKNEPFIEDIKTENNDVAPEAAPTVKNETVAEEISTIIDDFVPQTQNNSFVISDIKIINSFSLKLKFEDDPQLDCEEPSSTENEVGNINSTESQDMVEVVDNIVRPETPQSTHMTFDDRSPDNNEIYSNKSDKQLKRDIISHSDDDDSQSTIILVCDDEQEQAGSQETDNDAQQVENAEINMNTNDFGSVRVRDGTEIIKIQEEPGASKRIKIEKADDQRTKTKLRKEKKELIKNREIIDLSDDDDVAEISTVETMTIDDDDKDVCVKIKEEPETIKHIKIEKADDQRTKTDLRSENEQLNKNTEIINLSDDDDITEISTVETMIIDDDEEDVCVKIKEEPGTSERTKIEKADDQRTKTKLRSENEELNKNTESMNLFDDDDITEISTVETIVIDDDNVDVERAAATDDLMA